MIGADNPSYLTEITIAHAMRAMRDWIIENPSSLHEVNNAEIHAGNQRLMIHISRWFTTGTLSMQSAVASLFIKDMHGLRTWLQLPLAILPMRLPEVEVHPEALPWIPRELLHMVEELRSIALVELTQNGNKNYQVYRRQEKK